MLRLHTLLVLRLTLSPAGASCAEVAISSSTYSGVITLAIERLTRLFVEASPFTRPILPLSCLHFSLLLPLFEV